MIIREFYLLNNFGQKWDLSTTSQTPLTSPTNLGIQNSYEFLDLGNKFLVNSKSVSMTKPTGTIVFYNGYQGYNDFMDFIANADSLRLFYKTTDERYIDVEVESVAKTEKTRNVLQCQIVFNKLSYWKKQNVVQVQGQSSTKGKIYPYTYSYVYSLAGANNIRLTNSGNSPTPLTIEIQGNFSNPEYTLYDQNEIEIANGRINVTADTSTDILQIVATEGEENVYLIDEMGSTSIYNKQDFSTDVFIMLPVGTSYIEFRAGSSDEVFNYRLIYEERYINN